MPFLSYPEQVGYDKGEKAGFDKGEKAGLEKGERTGLLRALEAALGAKFKEEGLALLPRLKEQQDLDLLARVLATITTTDLLEDVRRLIP